MRPETGLKRLRRDRENVNSQLKTFVKSFSSIEVGKVCLYKRSPALCYYKDEQRKHSRRQLQQHKDNSAISGWARFPIWHNKSQKYVHDGLADAR